MKIINVICGINTGREIDLQGINEKYNQISTYKKEKFPGLSMKLPNSTILLFKTGNIVSTGTKNLLDARQSIEKTLEILNMSSNMCDNLKIYNIVASSSVPYKVNLHLVYKKCKTDVILEPELFPGLMYRMKYYSITCIVFTSGKFILT